MARLAPDIAYCQTKYKKVAASTTDTAGGVIIPSGQTAAVISFRANAALKACVLLAFDWGGAGERIIAASTRDSDIQLNTRNTDNQVTGDGTKKLQVIIINDHTTDESPYVGGAFEAVKLG